jgi:hypothetical protein
LFDENKLGSGDDFLSRKLSVVDRVSVGKLGREMVSVIDIQPAKHIRFASHIQSPYRVSVWHLWRQFVAVSCLGFDDINNPRSA